VAAVRNTGLGLAAAATVALPTFVPVANAFEAQQVYGDMARLTPGDPVKVCVCVCVCVCGPLPRLLTTAQGQRAGACARGVCVPSGSRPGECMDVWRTLLGLVHCVDETAGALIAQPGQAASVPLSEKRCRTLTLG